MKISSVALACALFAGPIAEAEKFTVRNEGMNQAEVQYRRGSTIDCDAMTAGGKGPVRARSARTWTCDEGQNICYRYKKIGQRVWSRWHTGSCNFQKNVGNFY